MSASREVASSQVCLLPHDVLPMTQCSVMLSNVAIGLLLDIVSEPIRAYLRSRSDTIRCIVSMLTEDPSEAPDGAAGSSLLEELQEQQQQGMAGSFAPSHMTSKDLRYNWWV